MADARPQNPAAIFRENFSGPINAPPERGANPASMFKDVVYKPEMNSPPSGILEGIKGALGGAYEEASKAATSTNPLKPTPEQEEELNAIENPYLRRAAIGAAAVPYTAKNILDYTANLLTSAIGGGLGGGAAGYRGQPENRGQLIEQGKREGQNILDTALLADVGISPRYRPQFELSEQKLLPAPSARPEQRLLPPPQKELVGALPPPNMRALPKPSTIYPEVREGQLSEPWRREHEEVQGVRNRVDELAAQKTLRDREGLPPPKTPDIIYSGVSEPPKSYQLPKPTEPLPAPEPQSVGAAVVRPEDRPPPQTRQQFVSEVEDDLYRLKTNADADKLDMLERAKELPEEAKNPAIQEKLNAYGEGDPNAKLTPEEKVIFDEHIAPIVEDNRRIAEMLMEDGLDEGLESSGYMRRVPKGRGSRFDPFAGDYTPSNPVHGSRVSFGTGPNPTKARVYHAIEDAQGNRKIVAIRDGQLYLPSKTGEETKVKAVQPIRMGDEKNKKLSEQKGVSKGDRVLIDGKPWDVKDAYTRELEEQTPTQYHKNAFANAADANVGLRAAERASREIKRIRDSPGFEQFARPSTAKEIPPNWRETTFPLFRGYRMEPHLAEAFDDFWHTPNKPIYEKLAAINRYANQSLFWSPTPHALNAFAHWFSARGWDNITPQGMKSLVKDGAQAIKEVVTLGPKYRQLLREGNALLYGGVENQKFYETLLKRVGEDIQRNPAKWDPIARALGVGPSTLVEMLYSGASKALWAASDMFMMQRVLENERKGMSTRQAIKDAERHVINYRVPTRVLGSRTAQEILTDPNITQFSRYHYGMMRSLAHMAKDVAIGSPKEKFEAVGNILATGALMFIFWPVINYGLQHLTGAKGLNIGSPGSTKIPQGLLDMWNGDKTMTEFISGLVTVAPGTKEVISQFLNRDPFTGKAISDPEAEREGRFDKALLQRGEHAASAFVQPYGAASQSLRKESLGEGAKDFGTGLLLQAFGLQNKTPERVEGREKAKKIQAKESVRRSHKPPGALERWIYGE